MGLLTILSQMHKRTNYLTLAIQAAKTQNWEKAVEYNQTLIEEDPKDVGAWNRLGIAYLQQQHKNKARDAFQQVLEIDRSNPIAKRNLDRIAHNQPFNLPTFSNTQFIDEPGKTKTTALHRLAGKQAFTQLTIGSECELKPKNRYISVESAGTYIGALPEDISFRLTKLMSGGNTYSCWIRSIDDKNCSVFLKESFSAPGNRSIPSFPVNRATLNGAADIDELTLLDDDIPMEIVTTDEDEDRSGSVNLKDFDDMGE
jgi:tetratricopeptide (TPR) repeat protein